MLRTLRFSTHRCLSGEEVRRALAIAREAAGAAERVPGMRSCTPYLDPDVLVFSAEFGCCADAERALTAPDVQVLLARLGAEFGYVMCEDEFSRELSDIVARSQTPGSAVIT